MLNASTSPPRERVPARADSPCTSHDVAWCSPTMVAVAVSPCARRNVAAAGGGATNFLYENSVGNFLRKNSVGNFLRKRG